MKVQVRAATELDIMPLISLADEYISEAKRWSALKFDPERAVYMAALAIMDPHQEIFVAHRDEQLCGFIWVAVAQPMWTSDFIAHDVFLFVPKKHRNLITAVQLVSEFELWAEALGAKAIHAGANSGIFEDKPASALYSRLGYEQGGNNFYKQL